MPFAGTLYIWKKWRNTRAKVEHIKSPKCDLYAAEEQPTPLHLSLGQLFCDCRPKKGELVGLGYSETIAQYLAKVEHIKSPIRSTRQAK
jgi:hypothetical protein